MVNRYVLRKETDESVNSDVLTYTDMADVISFFDENEVKDGGGPMENVPTGVAEGAPMATQVESEVKPEAKSEVVETNFSDILSSASASGATTIPVDPVAVSVDAATVGQTMDVESRISQLMELATVKGVAHAVSVARKLNDFYILDKMHDDLADKFYQALHDKGLLDE